jgi:hypothetical protein
LGLLAALARGAFLEKAWIIEGWSAGRCGCVLVDVAVVEASFGRTGLKSPLLAVRDDDDASGREESFSAWISSSVVVEWARKCQECTQT